VRTLLGKTVKVTYWKKMTVLIKTETHYLLLGKTEKYEDMSVTTQTAKRYKTCLFNTQNFNVNTVEITPC